MKPERALSRTVFNQLFLVQTAICAVVLGVLGVFSHYYFEKQYLANVQNNIRDYLESLYYQMPENPEVNWCRGVVQSTQFRLSVIQMPEGRVTCDSKILYESYLVLDRPEVQDALNNPSHQGRSVRLSETLRSEVFYGTRYIPEKKIMLRVGIRIREIKETLRTFDRALMGAGLILTIVLAAAIQLSGHTIVFSSASKAVRKKTAQIYSQFLAHVSHELRTPLTSIKGFSDTILLDLSNGRPAEADFVKTISQESDRLLGLVNNLLDLSALESGEVKVNQVLIDTKDITDEVVRRLNPILKGKNQEVETCFGVETAYADPGRIVQVLINLIANASKFSPEGSKITVAWVSAPGGVHLVVQDEGPGVPKEFQKTIFERFQQLDTEAEGTGLGLAIVKEIAELHGGEIQLKSESGKGAVFKVLLPESSAAPEKS